VSGRALGKRDPFRTTYRPLVERPHDAVLEDGPLARLDLAQLRLSSGPSAADALQPAAQPWSALRR